VQGRQNMIFLLIRFGMIDDLSGGFVRNSDYVR
jgi:hypothetical protein